MGLKIIHKEQLLPLLNHSRNAAIKDVHIFLKWERGEVTTPECIYEFREHNQIPQNRDISIPMFEEWLGSLGYLRGIYYG